MTLGQSKWLGSAASMVALMVGLSATSAIAQDAQDAPAEVGDIVVTGTRIKSAGLSSTSPVSELSGEQIQLQRAVTVEDFSVKIPQLAGGVNSTSVGSDAFGAQTLDLRSLGQNRTLVLINGTRAVPFSFRNAVDVNAIPAPLLKRVDVLTGGAAAVYGADAVAGVVNFIINDEFKGIQGGANYRAVADGASQYSVNLLGGVDLGGRGNIVGYVEYTDRNALLAGDRSISRRGAAIEPIGGNFTDVASGRTFSFDANGAFTRTPQSTDYTSQFLLVQPLKRFNADVFFKYDVLDSVEAYGRVMYSQVKTRGGTRTGQNPPTTGAAGINVQIAESNTFLPPEARQLLTFVNGFANVNVRRSLGELGTTSAENDRETYQAQIGLRGQITPAIGWDAYYQYGQTTEDITVRGDGIRANFAGLVNQTDIFGPGGNFTSLLQDFDYGSRKRKQQVASAYVSGDTSDFFAGWAGPVGFTLGYEYRKENGRYSYGTDLSRSFNQGAESAPPIPPFIQVNELFGELVVPVLADLPLVQKLTLEGAYRRSWYEKSVGVDRRYDTDKIGINWIVSDDLRLRATRQTVIRDANMGEFANPVFSIPFANLVTVARLFPRYAGDPCALGTGNAEQCARQGYKGSYNSRDPLNLQGGYFFGGNANIRAERGKTFTVGGVLTPRFLPGFSLSVDYYDIKIRDAVGQIQPVDAITSCYITDPSANNPLCQAVTRNATTGYLQDAFVDDRNLASINQAGVDVDMTYGIALPDNLPGKRLTVGYQASFVTEYTIQRNAALAPINCKGTYGARCSSDLVTLVTPDYRHRATLTWDSDPLTVQFGWKRIGKVRDSAAGSTGVIPAYNYYDLNIAIRPPIEGLTIAVGIDNLFDKKPPRPVNFGAFNTYPDTYDVLGQTFGLSLTLRR
ncbi:TonB-dependent receptor plug domain-containing protein [Sphingobium algorifonticola]|uniref:TonB-dependent receptor n=1 Tax=Sphingobium algorifonticola TaxID=2008318 RepID=A0A437J9W9_9SPHN|nr:TonB-dependent receptor plug domain-containing protein [Sphingobium algorifonticola]RVT42316.1 TonB-dependent receptor [Sphingobium algorifonticola]